MYFEVCFKLFVTQIVTAISFKFFKKLNNPDFKFFSENVYILPPSLTYYDPVCSSNTRYLNKYHALNINPLKHLLNIELYNE